MNVRNGGDYPGAGQYPVVGARRSGKACSRSQVETSCIRPRSTGPNCAEVLMFSRSSWIPGLLAAYASRDRKQKFVLWGCPAPNIAKLVHSPTSRAAQRVYMRKRIDSADTYMGSRANPPIDTRGADTHGPGPGVSLIWQLCPYLHATSWFDSPPSSRSPSDMRHTWPDNYRSSLLCCCSRFGRQRVEGSDAQGSKDALDEHAHHVDEPSLRDLSESSKLLTPLRPLFLMRFLALTFSLADEY